MVSGLPYLPANPIIFPYMPLGFHFSESVWEQSHVGSNPTRCARKPFAFASGFFHAILQKNGVSPGKKFRNPAHQFLCFFSFFFLSFPYFLWSSPPVLPFLYFQLKISFHGMGRSEFGRIVLRPIWIFACSKVLHISLLPHRIQELSTIDFQGKNHCLTSIGIPKKRGKDALWLQENREASR